VRPGQDGSRSSPAIPSSPSHRENLADGWIIGATTFALAGQPDLEDLVLAIPLACHLRVWLEDPDSADSLGVRDAHDEPLNLTVQIGGILAVSQGVQIEGGATDLLHTTEAARTLVLRKDGREVARIPIRLRAGEVNEVRN
jgi:hypothetical protein